MFECKICGRSDFEKITQLTTHIQYHHKDYTVQTYYDRFLKRDGEGICRTCGCPTPFRNIFKGYQKYCSNKCVWQDPEVKAKRAESISKLSESELREWRLKNIEAHRHENGKCISDAEIEKRKKRSESTFKDYFDKCDCELLEYITEPKKLVRFKCNRCGNESTYVRSLIDRMARNNDYGVCHFCNNRKSVSIPERDIRELIKSLEPGKIILNDRQLLDHNELDIVLPDKKIAIEYDGLYWHNEEIVDPKYHLKKTELCESIGYQLIHIFEDEWRFKKDIVISRLKSILGRNDKIYARETECRVISSLVSREFLEKNHVQGSCRSKWQYGLFNNESLVAVMTFGKSRFSDEYELLRFANKTGFDIIGGASKLLHHFLKDHMEISKIVSYADRRWSKGNLYEKLRFALVSKTDPSYFYIVNHKRESRMKFQKHKLVAEGFDPGKSEREIMRERGIKRIYDCGTLKYELSR